MTLSLVNANDEDYLYASELDRNAISILGLREWNLRFHFS